MKSEASNKFYSQDDYIKLMEFAVENSWIGCIIANKDAEYVYANKMYESVTGASSRLVTGLTANYSEKDAILTHNSTTLSVIKEKKEVILEQHLLPLNRKVLVKGIPFFDGDGEVKYVLSQLIDINKLNRLNKEVIISAQKKENENIEIIKTKATPVAEAATDFMVYNSKVMNQVLDQARKVARSAANVLILEESGPGKELISK